MHNFKQMQNINKQKNIYFSTEKVFIFMSVSSDKNLISKMDWV